MPRQIILALALALAVAVFLQSSGSPAAAQAPGTEGHVASKAVADEGAGHDHAAGGHGEANGQPNILEPQPSLAIWTVVVFVGLLLVLGRFAWRPLLDALQQREAHLEHVLHDTERARNEAEAL